MKTGGKSRQANFELLRVIAMAMVVTLHFFSKGGLLKAFPESFALRDHVIWLAEAFCSVAVNVYVLISGYFLVEAEFRPGKVLRLWAQIFFYSVSVPAACMALGLLKPEALTTDRVTTWLLPFIREHYWFASIYLLLYVLSPLLGRAVKGMQKKQLGTVLGILLLLCSAGKSVLPVSLALDTGGYDLLWFLCLYLTAAYLRLLGIPKWMAGWRGLLGYGVCAAGIYGLSMGYRQIYLRTGRLGDFYTGPYQYNHVLCLLAAVLLFGAFSVLQIRRAAVSKGICVAASCTFGVYLLHENEALRMSWPSWFGVNAEASGAALFTGWAAAIAVWFVIGLAVDLVRQRLFRMIGLK